MDCGSVGGLTVRELSSTVSMVRQLHSAEFLLSGSTLADRMTYVHAPWRSTLARRAGQMFSLSLRDLGRYMLSS